MFWVGDHHVGGQAVGKGAHFPSRATGRGLAGQREGAVARLADFAGQQVNVVDHVVRPDTAGVLVEAHGPAGHDLDVRVRIDFCQPFQAGLGDAGFLGGPFQGVGFDEFGKLLEGDIAPGVGFVGAFGPLLAGIFGAQAVPDIVLAFHKAGVFVDELVIDLVILDQVVRDVVENDQVGVRLENYGQIRQIETAGFVGGHGDHLDMLVGELAVGDPAPQHRVHFRHVRSPQHERIGVLDVVIAAHGLVDAEGAHEAAHRRGHAVARVGVEVVAAQPALEQLAGRVGFPDGPLPGPKQADALRAMFANRLLQLVGEQVHGLVPGDFLEVAVLVVLAVAHPQQRFV